MKAEIYIYMLSEKYIIIKFKNPTLLRERTSGSFVVLYKISPYTSLLPYTNNQQLCSLRPIDRS